MNDDLIKKIIERLKTVDNRATDDVSRLCNLTTSWENGRDAYEHKRQTGVGYKTIAEKCGIVYTTLQRYVRFYQFYPDGYEEEISGKPLMWGHYHAVLYLWDPKERQWYLEQAAFRGWKTHELRRRVSNNFYESAGSDSQADRSVGTGCDLSVVDQQLYTYRADVLEVIDADTLRLEVDMGFSMKFTTKIRLRGINAAEKGTKKGDEAKKFVEEQLGFDCFEKPLVAARTYSNGKYGRPITDVWYLKGENDPEEILKSGKFLNQVLLDEGHAEKAE